MFAPKAKLIRCDVDQYELARIIKDEEEDYNIDAKSFMEQLMDETIPDYSEWWNRCKRAQKLLSDYDDTEGNKLMKKISEVIPENPIITVDIGQTVCWAAQSLHIRGKNGRIVIGWQLWCNGSRITIRNWCIYKCWKWHSILHYWRWWFPNEYTGVGNS